ncbi:uncharacterized protein LOC141904120 [Tubulanus polymorphus]|uniref:uncharacterized protein LOC141904120 n=1 Tax=Tubulanus polymorphus TaxID=672921 RepID=UPI003DA49A4D
MMAPLAYGFWHTIKLKWPQICADIETGKLSIRAPDPAHSTIAAHLTANPQRAAFLRKHFNMGLTGIAKRIWPRLKVFFMVGSGPLSAFANILKQEELTGVDVCNVTHISTETIMGSAVAYQGDRYVLCIDHTFFEFIPDTDMHSETPKTVLFADQLEVNKCYEIVVTTHSGLYRYRMGDVIKVVGFFNEKTPIYEFMYRSGQMLQVAAEKTPENTFLEAIVKTEKQLQYELGDMKFINYTACENFYIQKLRKNKLDDGRHYVLFLEIEGKNLTEIQKALFDENLCSLFERYEQLRHAGSITAMEIIPVKSGTFDKLRDLISSQRFNPQYKIPRVQRREEPLRILLDNIA